MQYQCIHDFQSCALDQLSHLSKHDKEYTIFFAKSQVLLQIFFFFFVFREKEKSDLLTFFGGCVIMFLHVKENEDGI